MTANLKLRTTSGGSVTLSPADRLDDLVIDPTRGIVSVKDYGAVGDGVTDDTAAINLAITAALGSTLVFPNETYLISSGLSFASWTGNVEGTGVIRCQSGVAINTVLDFTNADRVNWDGVDLDMGQTASTLDGDLRSDNGFYFLDSRSCRITNCTISNVRVGGPIYIDGTSSVTPLDSHGSKRIFFENVQCVAFSYPTVDMGAFIYLRSDFYVGDGAGLYFSASNACKVSDYTLDQAVAYKRTTSDIYFTNCYFENFDRVGYYNVKNIHFSNTQVKNFYTRGHSMSPSCEQVTVIGGSLSGNAAQVNANYACQDLVFANLVSEGESVAVGQRHSLRCGFGTNRVRFSNISGVGNDVALAYIEGASDISFDGISLNNYQGGNTTLGLVVTSGPVGNTTSFITSDIKLSNCTFGANYGLRFETNGTGTIAQRGVKISNCHFNKNNELFNGAMPTGGQIEWINSTATVSGSAQTLDPKAFSVYEGSNISMKMWDTFTAVGATTYPTFTTVYFPTTLVDGAGSDATRVPPVDAYIKKSGGTFFQPLLYGSDWFIDGTLAALGMINKIRMYTPTNIASGDIIAIKRNV